MLLLFTPPTLTSLMDPMLAAAAFLFAVKIKDGLFVGNAASAHDDEFLSSNKITHIINCAALEVGNGYPVPGLQYLAFPWRDSETAVLIDAQGRNIEEICQFIRKAQKAEEGVLVQSLLGRSRCSVVVIAVLMKMYGWSLDSAVEFVRVKNIEMELKRSHIEQLQMYAYKLYQGGPAPMENILAPDLDEEVIAQFPPHQIVLRNTYFNSLTRSEDLEATIQELQGSGPGAVFSKRKPKKKLPPDPSKRRLTFSQPLIEMLEEGPRREPHLGDGAVQPTKSNLRRRGESAQGSSSGVVELPGGVAARNVPVSTTEDFSPLEEADPREANSPEGTEEDLTPQDPSESYMRMQSSNRRTTQKPLPVHHGKRGHTQGIAPVPVPVVFQPSMDAGQASLASSSTRYSSPAPRAMMAGKLGGRRDSGQDGESGGKSRTEADYGAGPESDLLFQRSSKRPLVTGEEADHGSSRMSRPQSAPVFSRRGSSPSPGPALSSVLTTGIPNRPSSGKSQQQGGSRVGIPRDQQQGYNSREHDQILARILEDTQKSLSLAEVHVVGPGIGSGGRKSRRVGSARRRPTPMRREHGNSGAHQASGLSVSGVRSSFESSGSDFGGPLMTRSQSAGGGGGGNTSRRISSAGPRNPQSAGSGSTNPVNSRNNGLVVGRPSSAGNPLNSGIGGSSIGSSAGAPRSRLADSPYATPPIRLPTPPRRPSSGGYERMDPTSGGIDSGGGGSGRPQSSGRRQTPLRRPSSGGGGGGGVSNSSQGASSRLFKPTASTMARYR